MALVKCYECGEDVSTHAEYCPHCGAPMQAHAADGIEHAPEIIMDDEEERVLFRTRLHWLMLVPALALALFGAALSIAYGDPTIVCLGTLVCSIWLIERLLTYISSEFVVTTRRITANAGFIPRRELDWMLNQVESVKVERSLGAQFMDYGTVVITGSGHTQERFRRVAHPEGLRNAATGKGRKRLHG